LRPDGLTPGRCSASDEIETVFFSRIDAEAALVHRKLISSGTRELSIEDRCVWALFLNSLLERSPRRIAEIEQSVDAAELFAEFKGYWPRLNTQEILNRIDAKSAVRNTLLRALVDYIVDEPFVKYVSEMVWTIFDLREGEDHFLTGDCPLVVNGGRSDDPIYFLTIALSPERLLVMHKDVPDFDSGFVQTLAIMHSIQVITQTERHLVSSRRLIDSPSIKYVKAVEQRLSILRPSSELFD